MSLNTNTGLALIQTQSNAGTITLPNTTVIPGRIVTFKDGLGTFQTNPFTLATQAGEAIDAYTVSSIQSSRFGWTTLVAGEASSWYVIGGTQMNTVVTSNLNASSIQADVLLASEVITSAIEFQDLSIPSYVSKIYPSTGSLYYQTPSTTIAIAGGPRQSFGTQFLQVQ